MVAGVVAANATTETLTLLFLTTQRTQVNFSLPRPTDQFLKNRNISPPFMEMLAISWKKVRKEIYLIQRTDISQ